MDHAEYALTMLGQAIGQSADTKVATAQVHATLALVAATEAFRQSVELIFGEERE